MGAGSSGSPALTIATRPLHRLGGLPLDQGPDTMKTFSPLTKLDLLPFLQREELPADKGVVEGVDVRGDEGAPPVHLPDHTNGSSSMSLAVLAQSSRGDRERTGIGDNLDSHAFEVLDSQWGEVFQPMVGAGKLLDLLVAEPKRPHDVPLEDRAPRLRRSFTLRDTTEGIKTRSSQTFPLG